MAEIVDGKAVLVGPDGGLVQVDPKSVEAKVSTGLYKEASPELIAREDEAIAAAEARRKHDEELTSVGAQLETGIKTGLNAVAAPAVWAAQKLGLGDIRNIGMTDEQAAAYHQREAELAAANPVAAGVGEVAGQAVLAGAGGVSAGARALAGRATTSALGRAATGAALEGGALGAAQAMEDPYADAQHVLAGGALGAALGGAIGAAGHGVESGLSKVFGRSALEDAAAREARISMQRDAAGEGEAFWDSMTAKASGAPKSLVEEFGVKNPGARKAAIDAVAHFDRYTEDTAFKMQEITRDLTKSVDDVLEQVRSASLKREGISKLMGSELEKDVFANRTAAGVMKNAGEMYSNELAGIDRDAMSDALAPLRRKMDATDRWLQKQIEAVGEAPDLSSKHALINETKQDLDKTVRNLRKSAQNQNLFKTDAETIQDVADRILKVSDELRSTLESPRIWGEKAAAAQKEVNAGWHEGGVDAMNAFGDAFERNTGKLDFETGRNVYDADATKFKAAVSGFGRTSGDVAERAMQDYIKNMRRMVDSVDKRYDLTAGKINSLDTAKARLDELEKLYQSSSKHIGMVNRWKELGSYNQAGNATLTGAILGAGLGAGPVGALAGGGYSALANPTGAAANLANSILSGSVFQARRRVAGALTNKVTRWIDAGGKAASSARADVTSAAITTFRGKYPTDEKATNARIAQLQAFDPARLSEHVSDLPDDVAMQAGIASQRAIDYLKSKIPAYMSAPSLVRSGRPPVMSRPDQIQFARIMGTVLDPTNAAKDLVSGRLTQAQVDALREVYPAIYDDLRISAVAALGARNSTGKPLPAQVRQQLSMLLDLGDAGDPVLAGGAADRIAQAVGSARAEEKKPQPPRPPSGQSKLAQAARSPLESELQ